MNRLLSLLAVPMALTAAPSLANDCTTAATSKPPVAANEAIVREMLTYALEQGVAAAKTDCRTVVRAPDCVDCPEGRVRSLPA